MAVYKKTKRSVAKPNARKSARRTKKRTKKTGLKIDKFEDGLGMDLRQPGARKVFKRMVTDLGKKHKKNSNAPKKRSAGTKRRNPAKPRSSPNVKKRNYERPSPAVSATRYPIGYRKKGNDGNMYRIIRTSAGIHRWSKVAKK